MYVDSDSLNFYIQICSKIWPYVQIYYDKLGVHWNNHGGIVGIQWEYQVTVYLSFGGCYNRFLDEPTGRVTSNWLILILHMSICYMSMYVCIYIYVYVYPCIYTYLYIRTYSMCVCRNNGIYMTPMDLVGTDIICSQMINNIPRISTSVDMGQHIIGFDVRSWCSVE